MNFKERVGNFWKEFIKEEKRIRKMMDEKEYQLLVPLVEKLLHLAFVDIAFEMGINDENKYELIVTPAGNKNKQYLTRYWKECAPSSLLLMWNFYSTKPAHPIPGVLSMYGVDVSASEITLYPKVEEGNDKVDILIYHEKINELVESDRYNLLFVLLDTTIGEAMTESYLGAIEFVDKPINEESITMDKLKYFIEDMIKLNNWSVIENPDEFVSGYEMKPIEEGILRSDIIFGYTSNFNLLNEYYSNESSCMELMENNLATYGFLYYDNTSLNNDNVVSFRTEIEELFIDALEELKIGYIIGGATGIKYSYIDLVIFDLEAFKKIMHDTFAIFLLGDLLYSPFKQEAIIEKMSGYKDIN